MKLKRKVAMNGAQMAWIGTPLCTDLRTPRAHLLDLVPGPGEAQNRAKIGKM